MKTKYDGSDLSGFGDITTFQMYPNFPFKSQNMDYSPWGSKIELALKIQASRG